ncbi:hypothetical protein [Streptomyces sp. R44]|uniref:Uncharacterized protein n=1 Tax=Streptomyces sp. R44 TaxID=3238633 RepID=A0AB39T9L3_9ACTN
MTRRMQANEQYRRECKYPTSFSRLHFEEHDETPGCKQRPACTPIANTVTVPATGTVLVVDGVVQEVKPVRQQYRQKPSDTHWTVEYKFTIEPPKPTFFEPGKTYERFADWSIRAQAYTVMERFDCTAVEKDGDGNLVAFGRITSTKGGRNDTGIGLWYPLHKYEWTNEDWTEQS